MLICELPVEYSSEYISNHIIFSLILLMANLSTFITSKLSIEKMKKGLYRSTGDSGCYEDSVRRIGAVPPSKTNPSNIGRKPSSRNSSEK